MVNPSPRLGRWWWRPPIRMSCTPALANRTSAPIFPRATVCTSRRTAARPGKISVSAIPARSVASWLILTMPILFMSERWVMPTAPIKSATFTSRSTEEIPGPACSTKDPPSASPTWPWRRLLRTFCLPEPGTRIVRRGAPMRRCKDRAEGCIAPPTAERLGHN